jgi:protein tyrosine phosphatase (PTP) superfamily phosphohydrolase (DUF442 family)
LHIGFPRQTKFILLISFILLLAYAIYLNIHCVIPGELYRSGQLPAPVLRWFVQAKGIRTVINLRGTMPYQSWYQHERTAVAAAHAQLFDSTIVDSVQIPDAKNMQLFLQQISGLPKPWLIHCEGGAERTSLAVILILLQKPGVSWAELQTQTSWQVHAFHKFTSAKLLLAAYGHWLQQRGLSHQPKYFQQWLQLYLKHQVTIQR